MNTEISEEILTSMSAAERAQLMTDAKQNLMKLAMKAASLRSQIESIESSFQDHEHAEGKDLVELYAAMGLILPDVVEKTFDQVKVFHQSITANRRHHLGVDLEKLRDRLSVTMAEIERIEQLTMRLLET